MQNKRLLNKAGMSRDSHMTTVKMWLRKQNLIFCLVLFLGKETLSRSFPGYVINHRLEAPSGYNYRTEFLNQKVFLYKENSCVSLTLYFVIEKKKYWFITM